MMNLRKSSWMKKVALAALLAALPLVGWQAYAQTAGDETPIKGTVEVTEGADLEALAKITLEEAKVAAQAEVPGATVTHAELDEEDGYLVYEIELTEEGQEVDVVIDAGDGSALEVERDDEDGDDGFFDDLFDRDDR